MVKEKEKETPEVETPEVETLEPQTPTPEEIKAEYEARIASLEKERDETKSKFEEVDKGLKTAHSQLTKKDQELKRQAGLDTRIDGLEDTLKILAQMQSETLATGEMEPAEKTDRINRFDAEIRRQKETRDTEQKQAQQKEYAQQAWTLYERAKTAFGEDDVALLRVERFLDQGNIVEAEEKIARAEAKKTTDTKEKEPVESEEAKIEKEVEERLRKKMEEAGMLVSETGGPSGATLSDEKWFDEVYGAGKSDDHARAQKIANKRR